MRDVEFAIVLSGEEGIQYCIRQLVFKQNSGTFLEYLITICTFAFENKVMKKGQHYLLSPY